MILHFDFFINSRYICTTSTLEMQYYSNIIYKSLAIFFALLVFVTTVGISGDMHFCQDKLKSYSFFGKAKNCHELAAQPVGCKHHPKMKQGIKTQNKKCCSNKSFLFQLDQDKKETVIDMVQLQPLQPFVVAYVAVFYRSVQQAIFVEPHLYYKPPLITKMIHILVQSFLL